MEPTQQARETSSEQQEETMKILIEEAERLRRQIDKAQVHLINARLNNDEEGKKSAISEMETAMCDVSRLLKCFIERKDNIVDLGEVWHTLDLNASVPDSNIAYLDIIAIVDNKIVRRVNCLASLYRWLRTNAVVQGQVKWAYLKDLLPKGDNK